MRTRTGFFGDRRGAAAVEFALVIVPLILFLFGTIEFARLMWTRQSMKSLAVTAARCVGILEPHCISGTAYDETATKTFIIDRAASFGVRLATGDITVTTSAPATDCGIIGFSRVSINYTFNTVAPKLITSLAGGSVLTASACFPNQT